MGYFKDEVIRYLSETDKPNFVRQVNRGGTWCNVPVWKAVTTNRSSNIINEKWFKEGIDKIRRQKKHRKRKYGSKYLNNNDNVK